MSDYSPALSSKTELAAGRRSDGC